MTRIMRKLLGNSLAVMLLVVATASAATAQVLIQPTPDSGLQPRLVTDAEGGVHLLYFKKRLRSPAAREGNLYYRQYDTEQNRFGTPVKVSSQAFNMQTFSIARSAMAIGGDGRVHVLWYLPRESQFIYSRSNPERSSFESQQSMVTEFVEGIDAGGDITARGSKVAIVWGAGDLSREYERTMFTRISNDNGASFGPELNVSNPDLGACACCSPATDFIDENDLLVAYRSAIDGIGRHMQLLTLNQVANGITGASYGPVHELQQWEISACPLSTNDIGSDADAARWLVFETQSRIMQLKLAGENEPTAVGEPFTETRQKNPAVAFNAENDRLIVWGEAISHARGGRLNLRLFNEAGQEQGDRFSAEITIPNYSFPAAAGLPGGGFIVLY